MTDTAYKTNDPAVTMEFASWHIAVQAINAKRTALGEELDRHVFIVRHGYGGGSTIAGFQKRDDEKIGDLVGDMRVYADLLLKPNPRRKAGKQFQKRLNDLAIHGIKLEGMPQFHLYCDDQGRMWSGGARMWEGRDGYIYALWNCDNAPMGDNWEKIKLSEYHEAHEARQIPGDDGAETDG